MPQIGSLDSTQVAQILRNLPGLLNKVRTDISPPTGLPFLVAGTTSGQCDLRVWLYGSNRRGWDVVPITHVITFGTYIHFDLPWHSDATRPAAFLFCIVDLVLMTSSIA